VRALGRSCLTCGLLLVPGVTVPVAAEVKTIVRQDGTRYMYNVGRSRARVPAAVVPAGQSNVELETLISQYAGESRLEVDLVKAVIQAESDFDELAVSRQGAMGLMQLMPATASDLAVHDPFDPIENVRAGTRYLRQMLDAFDGRLELALAAYNAGPEAVRRFDGIPPYPETIDYVEKVMRLYRGDASYVVRASRRVGRGRKTYLTRRADGQLILSTTPPGGR